MTIDSLQLKFYKGMKGKWGAIQLKPQDPHYYCPNQDCPGEERDDGRKVRVKDWNARTPRDCPVCRTKMKTREGAIFVEAASTVGDNVYDWDNKIRMALSASDLAKVLHILETGAPGAEEEIMHDPGAGSSQQGQVGKWLKISSRDGATKGVMLNVRQRSNLEESKSHTIPLSGPEVRQLASCIRSFIPKALGW